MIVYAFPFVVVYMYIFIGRINHMQACFPVDLTQELVGMFVLRVYVLRYYFRTFAHWFSVCVCKSWMRWIRLENMIVCTCPMQILLLLNPSQVDIECHLCCMYMFDTYMCKARLAGQFAKPRSKDVEEIDGRKVEVFRGENINGFDADSRSPDPQRLVQGYFHSTSKSRVG